MRAQLEGSEHRRTTLALVAGLLLLAAWLVLPGRSSLAQDVIGNGAFVGISAWAAVACLAAARRSPASRTTWLLLGLGAGAWSLGGLVYAYDQIVRHRPRRSRPGRSAAR